MNDILQGIGYIVTGMLVAVLIVALSPIFIAYIIFMNWRELSV